MRSAFHRPMLVAWALAILLGVCPLPASDLNKDEEILFFRSVVPVDRQAESCSLVFRGWVFEPERSSFTRRILLGSLARALGLPSGSTTDETFRERARMFLVDSERGERVDVLFGDGGFSLPKTDSDGSFQAVLSVSPASLDGDLPRWFRYRAKTPPGDDRRFEGEMQLVEPSGTGVISDIDDTIKQTEVLDRSEMLKNTFLRPFRSVPGMSGAYARLAARGAIFHYVSGSPRQLYPGLVSFLDESGFPRGELHLKRSVWQRGGKAPEMTSSTESHKLEAIEGILSLHPGRKYILIGDSGEKDPDIYAEIARRHPDRISKILIRRAPHADESARRYEEVFRGLPRDLWQVFTEPLPELNP